jgi:hypothetical protein
MKTPYFHGSSIDIQTPLRKGTCVSLSKANALLFAQRRRANDQAECYVYMLLLDREADLERHEDGAGVVDYVLRRDTDFFEQILVTPEVIAKCKEEVAADLAALL